MNQNIVGIDRTTNQPVTLTFAERTRGLMVLGKNGTGKSTLLENMIVADIEQGFGFGVLDPHGDLVQAVLKRVPKNREQDVVLLDITDTTFAFGINLFECPNLDNPVELTNTREQVVRVCKK